MQNDTSLIGYILAAVGAIVSTLVGLVTMFYKTQISDYKNREMELKTELVAFKLTSSLKITELEVRADECEDERSEIRVAYARLEQRVSHIEEHKQNKE